MADLGLLGAIGGLGQGMADVGKDILRRRELALEWAREEARELRKESVRQRERTEDKQFKVEEAVYRTNAQIAADERRAKREEDRDARRERAADERQERSIAATNERFYAGQDRQDARSAASRNAAKQNRAEVQMSKDEREAAGSALRNLQTSLTGNNSPAAQRLKALVNQSKNVIGVRIGAVDEKGFGRLFLVTKDGRVTPSGRFIHQSLLGAGEDEGF